MRDITDYRAGIEETLSSMRAHAQMRFQATLEEPSRQVSAEFEGMMQALEAKRGANAERCARLREQIDMVGSQLASLRAASQNDASRVVASAVAQAGVGGAAAGDRALARRNGAQLLHLKQWVRQAWAAADAGRGGRGGSGARERVPFLSRCLKWAPYTARLRALLERKVLDLRARAEARARAVAAGSGLAKRQDDGTAERMALASRLLGTGR